MQINDFEDISENMFWRGAALGQIADFKKLATSLGSELSIVGSHTSKSIQLPVVEIALPSASFTMRDNFHDTNLLVRLEKPCPLTLAEFFRGIQDPKDWDWYLNEISKARNYSWREWTDEEMADPQILLVKDKRPGCNLDWEKTPEEKERWSRRMVSPEWWSKDWSSGEELSWEGQFGPGVQIFRQTYPFAQGIATGDAPCKFVSGSKHFIVAVDSIEQAGFLIKRLR